MLAVNRQAAYSVLVVSWPLSPVVLDYLWGLDCVKVWRSKKIIWAEKNASRCLEQPLVAPFCRVLLVPWATWRAPSAISCFSKRYLLLVSEVVYLGCWRIWNFLSCFGCIQFQSKLNHPSCIKCMLCLMESWAEDHVHCFTRLHVFIQFSLENQGKYLKSKQTKKPSK